ncbi:hypothetical protein BH20ACI2_BH20ACI2_11800 [soil metagenome]
MLEFAMTGQPSKIAFTEFPVSSVGADTVAMPVISGERIFRNSTTITINTISPNAAILYTLDGTRPSPGNDRRLYKGPFTIDSSTTVRAIAQNPSDRNSLPVEAVFTRAPNDWTVRVISGYSTQYTGGGDNAIVDGIRGTTNFASGEWQGVQGKTYEAIVDLKRPTMIREVGGSFLQVALPWIWMPDRIEFETSSDGQDFTRVAEIKPGFPQPELVPTIREYFQKIEPTRARYVRIRAHNFGKIPSWHLGSGGDPWIFVDEIFIRGDPSGNQN